MAENTFIRLGAGIALVFSAIWAPARAWMKQKDDKLRLHEAELLVIKRNYADLLTRHEQLERIVGDMSSLVYNEMQAPQELEQILARLKKPIH